MASLNFAVEIFCGKAKIRNAKIRSVLNKILAGHVEDCCSTSAGDFAEAIEFQDDQFGSGLVNGLLQFAKNAEQFFV